MGRTKAHKYIPVQAELVEFICPSCEQGVLRVDNGKQPRQTSNRGKHGIINVRIVIMRQSWQDRSQR